MVSSHGALGCEADGQLSQSSYRGKKEANISSEVSLGVVLTAYQLIRETRGDILGVFIVVCVLATKINSSCILSINAD